MLSHCIFAITIQSEFAIRLCPESFSVCLGSSSVRLVGQKFFQFVGVMRACVGRKGGPRLRSRASSCGASQAHGHRPVAQGEARKARAQSLRCQCRVGGVRLHLKPLAIRRVGSMVDRSDARGQTKRLPRRELTLSWIGRPWVLRSSLRVEKDSRTDRQM